MYTVCSKTPEQEDLVQQTTGVCTGFTSGGYLASPRPLEASYPKYLVSLEDSLEPSRGQQEKRAPLRVHYLAPIWVKFQRLAHFNQGPSPIPCSSSPPCLWEGNGSYSSIPFSSKSCNKLGASERYVDTCFASSAHRIEVVHPSLSEACRDVVLGINQNS